MQIKEFLKFFEGQDPEHYVAFMTDLKGKLKLFTYNSEGELAKIYEEEGFVIPKEPSFL